MEQRNELIAQNFPTAQEEAEVVTPTSRHDGQEAPTGFFFRQPSAGDRTLCAPARNALRS
jgi:hypothetical protein